MSEWNWDGPNAELSLTDDRDGEYTLFVRNDQVDTWVTIPASYLTELREFLCDNLPTVCGCHRESGLPPEKWCECGEHLIIDGEGPCDRKRENNG